MVVGVSAGLLDLGLLGLVLLALDALLLAVQVLAHVVEPALAQLVEQVGRAAVGGWKGGGGESETNGG